MALVFSGVSVEGRVIYTNTLASGVGLIMLFPDKASTFVRREGTLEVLSLNTPLNEYVQKATIELWVRSHLVASTLITNNTHRLAVVWTRSGVNFQVHTT